MPESKVPKVIKAIAEVMANLPGLEKNKTAKTGKGGTFAYRGIDDLLDTLHPLLIQSKLIVKPRLINQEIQFHGERGMPYMAAVSVEYIFTSTEDASEYVVGPVLGTGADSMDKQAGKAMTSAFKAAMYQAFCVPVGDAMDVEKDSDKDGPSKKAQASYETKDAQGNPVTAKADKDEPHRRELHSIACKLSQNDVDVYTGYVRDWTTWPTTDKEGKPVTRYCTKASDTYPSGDFVLQGTRLNIALGKARESLANYEAANQPPAEGITPEEQEQIDSMLGGANDIA